MADIEFKNVSPLGKLDVPDLGISVEPDEVFVVTDVEIATALAALGEHFETEWQPPESAPAEGDAVTEASNDPAPPKGARKGSKTEEVAQ